MGPTSTRRKLSSFPWKKALREAVSGFLTAVGILPFDKLPKGAYWARKQSTGEWELRFPAYDWNHPPS